VSAVGGMAIAAQLTPISYPRVVHGIFSWGARGAQ
jgi:hypothetical protein